MGSSDYRSNSHHFYNNIILAFCIFSLTEWNMIRKIQYMQTTTLFINTPANGCSVRCIRPRF